MTPEQLESALAKLGNDAERYAYLMSLELQIKAKKNELRGNVLANFSQSPILVCGVQKNFKIDTRHRLGQQYATLKSRLKEIEEQAKNEGAGTYTETPFIRYKPPTKTKVETHEVLNTPSPGVPNYENFFFS